MYMRDKPADLSLHLSLSLPSLLSKIASVSSGQDKKNLFFKDCIYLFSERGEGRKEGRVK